MDEEREIMRNKEGAEGHRKHTRHGGKFAFACLRSRRDRYKFFSSVVSMQQEADQPQAGVRGWELAGNRDSATDVLA